MARVIAWILALAILAWDSPRPLAAATMPPAVAAERQDAVAGASTSIAPEPGKADEADRSGDVADGDDGETSLAATRLSAAAATPLCRGTPARFSSHRVPAGQSLPPPRRPPRA